MRVFSRLIAPCGRSYFPMGLPTRWFQLSARIMCLWYSSALSPKPVHGSQWALHPGLSVPALTFPSPYPPQAPIVFRYYVDSNRPVLASKALVSGSAGPSIRPAGTFSSSTTSPQPPALGIVIAGSSGFVFIPGDYSDLPGPRDSPPNLLLRMAWLGVLPLTPFPGWVSCVSPVVQVGTT